MTMAKFTTERGNRRITPISYKDMQELMHSLQLNFPALYLKDGGVLRRNGLCRMGEDPEGRVVLAFAKNPDDFSLAPPRKCDEDICLPGLEQAQFIDRSQGFDSFSRIYGLYARKARTHKDWVIDKTRQFENIRRQDFFDYGILCRVGYDSWFS